MGTAKVLGLSGSSLGAVADFALVWLHIRTVYSPSFFFSNGLVNIMTFILGKKFEDCH